MKKNKIVIKDSIDYGWNLEILETPNGYIELRMISDGGLGHRMEYMILSKPRAKKLARFLKGVADENN